MPAGDHYPSYSGNYVHVQRAHGPISRCGRQAWLKMHYLWRLWPVQSNSKYTEASFSPISMYSFALQVAQGPRTPKLAIFVRTTTTTTTTTDIQTDCFTPCACARGNYQWYSAQCWMVAPVCFNQEWKSHILRAWLNATQALSVAHRCLRYTFGYGVWIIVQPKMATRSNCQAHWVEGTEGSATKEISYTFPRNQWKSTEITRNQQRNQ